MDNYIGVKLLKAAAMTAAEAGKVLQRPIDVSNADSEGNGYLVEYADGYTSWSPKDVFEQAYIVVIPNPNLKSGVSISQQMVDDFIKETYMDTVGEKTTVVRAVLVNGFEIVESSSCVDAANYDKMVGAVCCMDKIKDKIWFLLGFLLQTAVGGVKNDSASVKVVMPVAQTTPEINYINQERLFNLIEYSKNLVRFISEGNRESALKVEDKFLKVCEEIESELGIKNG